MPVSKVQVDVSHPPLTLSKWSEKVFSGIKSKLLKGSVKAVNVALCIYSTWPGHFVFPVHTAERGGPEEW